MTVCLWIYNLNWTVGQLYRAQERQPDLTTQSAMPVLIRLLRDEAVWEKFMAELGRA